MADDSRLQSNIRPLNARIAQQIAASDARREASRRHYDHAHRLREKRIILVGLAVASIFLVQLILGQVRLHAANQTLSKSEVSLQSVQKDGKALHKTAEQLKDPAYLQQILRDKYGYSRKDEIIYNLPDRS
ncbi:septation ring formation regulator EzrA [Fructobacillus pseudoficulneus]|uniref:Septation ring formation regulator EzrA n=1 Tax=Fructobacillus pseudoficulneus TaxID=220714 RepID=A0A3F3GUR8_9LACO|nr:septum formation initiator family protein [Fructobacillus pseudoficulneus]GAP03151.1 septation ring formation regulator EzrA [Fructobacillus pseudoficulneus]SEH41036.1 cell division protein DivIC [Fructobacillus pseudoficulneus]